MVSSRHYRSRSEGTDRVVTRRWRTPGRRLRINPHTGRLKNTGTVPGKKTPGGAGTHTGHTGTRTTQTNLTTIQTYQPTAVRSQGGHCTRYGSRGTPRARNDHNGFISSCKAQLNPVSLRKLLPKGAGRGWIILYPSSCPDSKLSDLPKGAGGGFISGFVPYPLIP